jgi:hypothetical protein
MWVIGEETEGRFLGRGNTALRLTEEFKLARRKEGGREAITRGNSESQQLGAGEQHNTWNSTRFGLLE